MISLLSSADEMLSYKPLSGFYGNHTEQFIGENNYCRSEIALGNQAETTILINEKADYKEESRRAGTLGRDFALASVTRIPCASAPR